jgi:hypothetical protein
LRGIHGRPSVNLGGIECSSCYRSTAAANVSAA